MAKIWAVDMVVLRLQAGSPDRMSLVEAPSEMILVDQGFDLSPAVGLQIDYPQIKEG